jgi:hypothetical protein
MAWAAGLFLFPVILWAAQPRNQNEPIGESVDMFAAMDNGQIEVKLIPKDSTQSRIFITNKTDKPLSVQLPDTFGAAPVLAQLGAGGAAGAGAAKSTSSNQPQALGGGMGGMGGGMGGMGGGGMGGGGGGFFNVPPEKVGQLRVATVCLEHGQPNPRPNIPYEIKPLEKVSNKPEVREVCRLLASGKVTQRVAQIAAWHFANNMTWQQLAAEQYRFANGGGVPWFSPQEIRAGMQLAAVAAAMAEQDTTPTASPNGSNASLNKPR